MFEFRVYIFASFSYIFLNFISSFTILFLLRPRVIVEHARGGGGSNYRGGGGGGGRSGGGDRDRGGGRG